MRQNMPDPEDYILTLGWRERLHEAWYVLRTGKFHQLGLYAWKARMVEEDNHKLHVKHLRELDDLRRGLGELAEYISEWGKYS